MRVTRPGQELAGERGTSDMSIKRFTNHMTLSAQGAFALLCIVTLGVGLTPKAVADERDKKTIVTFSAPVEVPGKALPAGTYVFKVLDTAGSRSIVQILDKDEKQVYATI